jgi:type II secretory pathway pseudopilin PulG
MYENSPAQIKQCRVEERSGDAGGFSLVELLLVVGMVGVMLWVLIPIGLRARIEARYGVVRQHCSELASYTSQWAQQAIMAQDEERSVATLSDYYGSLAGHSLAPVLGTAQGEWVANSMGPSNWRRNRNGKDGAQGRPIDGRYMKGETPSAPEATVADMIPPSHPIVNPFTEVSVFDAKNHPRSQADGGVGPVPGAIALGGHREEAGGWVYFAFVFQGTQNAGIELDGDDTFLSEMNLKTLPGLRAGVFAARLP